MLATYSRFQPKIAPSLEFIKGFNSLQGLFGKEKIEPELAAAREMLRAYGFGHADEFDLVLIDGVESGFIQKDRLLEEAGKLLETMKRADRTRSFSEAWDRFHNSLENNVDIVLDRIYEVFEADFQEISANSLSGTITLFKEFGREVQAKEMLDLYINERLADPEFWDLNNSPLGGHVTDPEVRDRFATKFTSLRPAFNPAEFLHALIGKNGWDPEELAEMAKIQPEDYVKIFKGADEKEVNPVIR